MAQLTAWATRVLTQSGADPSHAACAASGLVRAEARGIVTHGLMRLRSYAQMLRDGVINPRPCLTHEVSAGKVLLMADGALGAVASRQALQLAREALRHTACVAVAVADTAHLGALGVHALDAAQVGLMCLVAQEAPPVMAMEGFLRAALGNNPLAFAAPMPDSEPFVFDMACSETARGRILLAQQNAQPIPEGWALDATGQPTTDASQALAGMLLPMGGHKGMGLAMMVQILAAGLSATPDSNARAPLQARAGGGVGRAGAFFLYIDPAQIAGEALYRAAMQRWRVNFMAAAGTGHTRLPGQRGHRLEQRSRESGVAIPETLWRDLHALAHALNVPLEAACLSGGPLK